jgi:hypothetical protein
MASKITQSEVGLLSTKFAQVSHVFHSRFVAQVAEKLEALVLERRLANVREFLELIPQICFQSQWWTNLTIDGEGVPYSQFQNHSDIYGRGEKSAPNLFRRLIVTLLEKNGIKTATCHNTLSSEEDDCVETICRISDRKWLSGKFIASSAATSYDNTADVYLVNNSGWNRNWVFQIHPRLSCVEDFKEPMCQTTLKALERVYTEVKTRVNLIHYKNKQRTIKGIEMKGLEVHVPTLFGKGELLAVVVITMILWSLVIMAVHKQSYESQTRTECLALTLGDYIFAFFPLVAPGSLLVIILWLIFRDHPMTTNN